MATVERAHGGIIMNTDTEGPTYCAEQVKIPPHLPDILKEFTKAAIRTQPLDVLEWSAAYFEALSKGEVPPVKARLEQPLGDRRGGLSKGVLAMLHKQLGPQGNVKVEDLREKWKQAGCDLSKLNELLSLGDMSSAVVEWNKLLAVSCTSLETSLPSALKLLCEILSLDPEGSAARIPLDQFHQLYKFLATVDGEVSADQVEAVMEFLTTESERHGGMVGPKEFLHQKCPLLDA